MEGYEQCDLGVEPNIEASIYDYLDEEGNVDAGRYANAGYYCENCAIKAHDAPAYQPPACFNVNTTISVMQ